MTLLGGRLFWVLGAFLLLFACEGPAQKKNEPPAPPMQSRTTQRDDSQLLAKARAAGTIRIIVTLDMPFQPDGLLSPSDAAKQQARIAELQDELCEALAGYHVSDIKRFKYTPSLGMAVDARALEALLVHPRVGSVEEDAPSPPAR